MKLPATFYQRENTQQIAKDLLGKSLCTNIHRKTTKAIITETEAYAGITDKASHAYGDKRTKRTEPMYGPGGHAYVYLCYGIHHLFNVVTNIEGIPHAILIRAGIPKTGEPTMLRRRGKTRGDKSLLAGPGSLAKALGITTPMTAADLTGNRIWIEDNGFEVKKSNITVGPRVGVDYAGEDAARPYRFILKL